VTEREPPEAREPPRFGRFGSALAWLFAQSFITPQEERPGPDEPVYDLNRLSPEEREELHNIRWAPDDSEELWLAGLPDHKGQRLYELLCKARGLDPNRTPD
jgi:hypothetical protein